MSPVISKLSLLQIRWKKRSRKVAWGSGACEHCFQYLIHVHTGIPYDWYVLTVNINTYVNHLALHAHNQTLCQTCESYTAHFDINILTQELVFLEVDEVMGGLRYMKRWLQALLSLFPLGFFLGLLFHCSVTFFTYLPWRRAWHRQLGEKYFLQVPCPVLSFLQLSWGCSYVELIVFFAYSCADLD